MIMVRSERRQMKRCLLQHTPKEAKIAPVINLTNRMEYDETGQIEVKSRFVNKCVHIVKVCECVKLLI